MVSNFRQRVFAAKTVAGLGAFPPQAVNGSSAILGSIIDRMSVQSAKLVLERAVVTGAPSAAAFAVVIQHGAQANLSDASTFVTLETALSVLLAGLTEYLINLEGAHRYIRVSITPTYTGGTIPANVVAGEMVLGDRAEDPLVENETVYGASL
jgi:hypothetical protein